MIKVKSKNKKFEVNGEVFTSKFNVVEFLKNELPNELVTVIIRHNECFRYEWVVTKPSGVYKWYDKKPYIFEVNHFVKKEVVEHIDAYDVMDRHPEARISMEDFERMFADPDEDMEY